MNLFHLVVSWLGDKKHLVIVLFAIVAMSLQSAIPRANDAQAYTAAGGAVITQRQQSYDYSPSVIQEGKTQRIWWCGYAKNPLLASQTSDTILYATYDIPSGTMTTPKVVLSETPGAWDSLYTCNASVIRGSFANPLSDGTTYTYAMYYVGTKTDSTPDTFKPNAIGVAFSNDGISWKKYPRPIITDSTTVASAYGVGEPALYNSGGSNITMFYEDQPTQMAQTMKHIQVTSTDGVHFSNPQTLSTNGLTSPYLDWGDMAYDPITNNWYAVFNNPLRSPASIGGATERGQPGYTLYRISGYDLINGTWTQLTTVDTALTGYEANFLAGITTDGMGNITVGNYPAVSFVSATSLPRPAANASPYAAASTAVVNNWDLTWNQWSPTTPLRGLKRYFSSSLGTHEITTGWVDSTRFKQEVQLGRLAEAPSGNATKGIYSCKAGTTNYFVSADSACEGYYKLGLVGYASPTQTYDFSVPLYRCLTRSDHFMSTASNCEGAKTEALMGYAAPNL